MDWLAGEVADMEGKRVRKRVEVEALDRQRQDLLRDVGLDDLQRTAKEYLKGFDTMTGIEKRDYLERLVQRVVVKPGNKLEILFYGQPPAVAVNRRKKSTEWEWSGSPDDAVCDPCRGPQRSKSLGTLAPINGLLTRIS